MTGKRQWVVWVAFGGLLGFFFSDGLKEQDELWHPHLGGMSSFLECSNAVRIFILIIFIIVFILSFMQKL